MKIQTSSGMREGSCPKANLPFDKVTAKVGQGDDLLYLPFPPLFLSNPQDGRRERVSSSRTSEWDPAEMLQRLDLDPPKLFHGPVINAAVMGPFAYLGVCIKNFNPLGGDEQVHFCQSMDIPFRRLRKDRE